MEYLIVVDFEANCFENEYMENREITEFPAVPICIKTKKVMHDKIFHHYCKIDEPLSTFATDLTGITQKMCDDGKLFRVVVELFMKWMKDNNFSEKNSILVTCGNWDFKTAFVDQCKYSGIKVPNYCKKWCNIKKIFKKKYKKYGSSMKSMLRYLDIELDGKHHSGIDDAKNIAKICIQLLNDNANFM